MRPLTAAGDVAGGGGGGEALVPAPCCCCWGAAKVEGGTEAGAGGGWRLDAMVEGAVAKYGACLLLICAGLTGRIEDAGVRAATSLERCLSTSSSLPTVKQVVTLAKPMLHSSIVKPI